MNESTKQKLIAQFSQYLETETIETIDQQTDLFSLFTELAALRNEVKLESRQVKNALEIFQTTFATMEDSHKQISSELTRCREAQTVHNNETIRTMLLAYLEIYDRIKSSITVLNTYKLPIWKYFCRQELNLIQGLQTGQAITLRRFEQFLEEYQVQLIEVLHQPINPHYMRVIEVDQLPNIKNGIVTEELRTGFLWKNEVLRPAEVKVNKIT
ncbi:MAG TPA: nucleotide exchange factor GrpE [Thioploca sp.]|nr:nucleotide exchange factor GrpE [Thioploca sp.]